MLKRVYNHRPLSKETKKKISDAHMGLRHSKETKKKMSASHTGMIGYWRNKKRPEMTGKNNPFYGMDKFGKNNSMWKGGKIKDKNGYVFLLKHNHPFSHKTGYIKRSRLVMEKKLGRYLTPEEVVHHINEIKDDDRPENLQLFANKSEHIKFHKINS